MIGSKYLAMHPDEMSRHKSLLEGEVGLIDTIIRGSVSSQCYLCQRTGFAFEDTPPHWAWLDGLAGVLMCDQCIDRWTARFGLPKTSREEDYCDW